MGSNAKIGCTDTFTVLAILNPRGFEALLRLGNDAGFGQADLFGAYTRYWGDGSFLIALAEICAAGTAAGRRKRKCARRTAFGQETLLPLDPL
jgi:hypothetical protein